MATRITLFILLLSFFDCEVQPEIVSGAKYEWKTIKVTATAYNSTKSQTEGDPFIGAFGDSLKPSVKSIAVSRDLFRSGLKHNTFVTIEGLKGIYLVKDKMHSRWNNKIDIYMGTDIISAKRWGRKKVNIHYRIKTKDPLTVD
jgi:3D (Asp-Asp-Asp) domain-containing protein